MKKLSRAQERALDVLRRHGSLVRRPGGLWSWPGCKDHPGGGPAWYVGTATIHALSLHGYLSLPNRHTAIPAAPEITNKGATP